MSTFDCPYCGKALVSTSLGSIHKDTGDELCTNWPSAVQVDGDLIALNAAALRLFKGEYRDSGDRHSDALFVREGIVNQQEELAALRLALAAAQDEAEKAKALAVEKTEQIASLQNDAFTAHALNESRCAALAKECEELRADKARPLVELMRAYEILHAFMSTEQIQQGGTFHLNKTDDSGSNRAISNAEAFSLISRFYNSDERATNAMRDLKAGNFKCISVDSAMVEYWPIARADAARKEPPAKAHGCEVGE